MGNTTWRAELTNVEKLGDDLWGGLKVQSYREIARSLRNIFRNSLSVQATGVERLDAAGARKCTHRNQTPNTVARVEGVSPREIIFVVKRRTIQTAG